ncbi:MAG: hypothetical protein JSS20_00810, partial [Proteobacteria bacterium]|nr:hypothetical protein [Pseudomonadota bacterium]
MKALRDTPWPVLLLIASFLCPTELSIYIGGARLPPHRALLLLLIPAALFALIGRGAFRPKLFDAAFLGFGAWTVFIYLYHHGAADGLQTGAALAIDSFGSFIVARAFVRDEKALVGTAGLLLLGVIFAGSLALPETLGGQIYTHDLMRQLTGYVHPTDVEKRMGLTRAFGPFDHPIHLGTFCASSLALAYYSARSLNGAALRIAIIAACTLTALSSAPMLCFFVQIGLIAYERMTRGISGRTAMAFGGIAVIFLGISAVATRSPFTLIAT